MQNRIIVLLLILLSQSLEHAQNNNSDSLQVERAAAYSHSYLPFNDTSNRIHNRSTVLVQTKKMQSNGNAVSENIEYEDILVLFWNSVHADYIQMLASGKAISQILKAKSILKLTSKEGTDITFKLTNYPAKINCGHCAKNICAFGPAYTWLPAGDVYACIDPASASGTIVIPRMSYRGNTVRNLKLTFTNGYITGLSADKNGKLISNYLETGTGDKDVLSIIDIGINPYCRELKDAGYYSWETAGMVTAYIGNNSWAGGNVVSDASMHLHLPNSTLSVEGKNIIINGQLKIVEQ